MPDVSPAVLIFKVEAVGESAELLVARAAEAGVTPGQWLAGMGTLLLAGECDVVETITRVRVCAERVSEETIK